MKLKSPAYAGMVESLDENVGRMLDWLDEKELADVRHQLRQVQEDQSQALTTLAGLEAQHAHLDRRGDAHTDSGVFRRDGGCCLGR